MNITFDEHQRVIIEAPVETPLQVITAAAGAGKTTTIAARIRHLIDLGIPASRIYAITFTQAGGRALREKIGTPIAWSGTLHAFAIDRLAINPRDILTEEEADRVIREISANCRIAGSASSVRRKILASATPDSAIIGNDGLILRAFKTALESRQQTTFDMILRRVAFEPNAATDETRGGYLFVDEYQDTSAIDAACYAAMQPAQKTVIGDPNQAIFGFRGSSERYLFRATRAAGNGGAFALPATWRCSRSITALANHVSGTAAMVAARDEPGEIKIEMFETEQDEHRAALEIAHNTATGSSLAILARTNAEVHKLRAFLEGGGIRLQPRTRGIDREEPRTRELMRYIRTAAGMTSIDDLFQSMSTRQQEMLTVRWNEPDLADHLAANQSSAAVCLKALYAPMELADHEAMKSAETVEDVLANLLDLDAPKTQEVQSGIFCDTIHGVKGLEFDTVILTGANDQWDNDDPSSQVRNLLYVAITRAKKEFIATAAKIVVDFWSGASLNRRMSKAITEAFTKAK
jgi:superfamily I DNA/RNA helicase